MPKPPAGEAELAALAVRFTRAEQRALEHLARHDPAAAVQLLHGLRLLAPAARRGVATAYLAEHPKGDVEAVRDLALSLHRRLDLAAQAAAETAHTWTRDDNLLTAAVDSRGTRWGLGHWAAMNCATVGRHATSRGLSDRVGHGNVVSISTGSCGWCGQHAGDAVIGTDPLPPFHPSCSCVATAA